MMKRLLLSVLSVCSVMLPTPSVAANLPAQGFSAPVGLLAMDDGSMLVAEWAANRITRMDASGKRESVLSGISSPAGLVRDNSGNIYIAGYGDGNIYVWSGTGQPTILASGFQQPTGLFWSRDNTLLVANRGAGTVEELGQNGSRKIISHGHRLPVGIAQTDDGAMYVSCYGGTVDRVSKNGSIQKIKNGLQTPGVGILAASNNSVFVVDNTAGTVVEADPSGVIEILAKNLSSPVGLAKTSGNGILVATWGDGKIQTVESKK